jgi:threonine aldolase
MPDTAPIDLRSDTVTRPSPAMREAMARAPVGDDQYGEDPSVNALEEKVAALLGKEAAVFVPSGTMANQIALRVMTRSGDEVIVGGEAHILWHETGAASALSGVQITPVGTTGLFDVDAFIAACKPRGHIVFPPTGMVVVENTHNRGGGIVFPHETDAAICAAADAKGLATYLDGARLFNAALVLGLDVATLAAPFRMASVSLSKGLGAPVGSVLAGTREDIIAARRVRRLYGGAMRQAGILAAAGLHALDHNIKRLSEDHRNARAIAEALSRAKGIDLDLSTVQTNIVIFRLPEGALDAAAFAARARERGVLVSQFGPRTLRLTTHLDVTEAQCREAADRLLGIFDEAART